MAITSNVSKKNIQYRLLFLKFITVLMNTITNPRTQTSPGIFGKTYNDLPVSQRGKLVPLFLVWLLALKQSWLVLLLV